MRFITYRKASGIINRTRVFTAFTRAQILEFATLMGWTIIAIR